MRKLMQWLRRWWYRDSIIINTNDLSDEVYREILLHGLIYHTNRLMKDRPIKRKRRKHRKART